MKVLCRTALLCIAASAIATAASEPPPRVRESTPVDDTPVTDGGNLVREVNDGTFINYLYGYSTWIPEAFRDSWQGFMMHGFSIPLDATGAEIGVYAGFNTAFTATLDEAVEKYMDPSYADKSEGESVLLSRASTRLGDTPAARLAVHRRSPDGEQRRLDVVLALRGDPNDDSDIAVEYVVTLLTSDSRYESDKRIFDELLHSWRMLPLQK
jgi:hypothetical protein